MTVLKVQDSVAFISDGENVTVYPLGIESDNTNLNKQLEGSPSSLTVPQDNETQSSPDPDKITVEDIERYEALMKGKAVSAISNSHAPKGEVSCNEGVLMHKRHTWLSQRDSDFGPMEL